MTFTRLWSWLGALYRWLGEARLAWRTVLVVVLALYISLRHGATEVEIRLTGLALQLAGIGTVAHGLHETRKLFGRPGIMTLFRRWASRFPRWRRHIIEHLAAGSFEIAGSKARAYVWTTMDPAVPVQMQLNALRQNVERLNERLTQIQSDLDTELHRHSEALGQEQQVRAKHDQDLQSRLEAAETGGLHISFIGVVLLFLGVLLTTLSPEIARWQS
jgi:hypothetical protein